MQKPAARLPHTRPSSGAGVSGGRVETLGCVSRSDSAIRCVLPGRTRKPTHATGGPALAGGRAARPPGCRVSMRSSAGGAVLAGDALAQFAPHLGVGVHRGAGRGSAAVLAGDALVQLAQRSGRSGSRRRRPRIGCRTGRRCSGAGRAASGRSGSRRCRWPGSVAWRRGRWSWWRGSRRWRSARRWRRWRRRCGCAGGGRGRARWGRGGWKRWAGWSWCASCWELAGFLSTTVPPAACGALAESQQPLSALRRGAVTWRSGTDGLSNTRAA